MTILGHGIDLVEIFILKRWIEDIRNPLIPRCFTARELAEIGDSANRVTHLAGRFAAKEAVMKALGKGFGNGIAFTDIEILRPPGKPPEVHLSGGAEHTALERGIHAWHLSISHTESMAIASALAIGIQTSGTLACGETDSTESR